MTANKRTTRIKVAIVGGGPGGLGAAIELSKLPFVDWDLYEKKPQISETGGGMSLQPHTWRLLEHNGAAKNIKAQDFYRGQTEQRRNGRNGKLLVQSDTLDDVAPHRRSCRLVRAKLQAALLKNVDQAHVHVAMKLVGVKFLPDNRIRITFENGLVDEVNLLIGADGIRSVVRRFSFPNHKLCYNGQVVYRTIVRKTDVRRIKGIPWAPVFWKHVSGLYVYTCPLGDGDFEVTARIRRPDVGHEWVSWGRPVDFHALLHEYDDFCLPIRQILCLAAEGQTQEFALYSGPRLQDIVYHGNIALIGDASHPLCGNFGAGAGFALEDVYALTKAIDWAWSRERPLADALDLFNASRSPYYARIYRMLDKFSAIKTALQDEDLSVDEEIEERVKRISRASDTWMYYYDIDKTVADTLREADSMLECHLGYQQAGGSPDSGRIERA